MIYKPREYSLVFFVLSPALLFFPHILSAQMLPSLKSVEQENLQQQRQSALEKVLMPQGKDVRLHMNKHEAGDLTLPVENNCFPVREVIIDGGEKLPRWLDLNAVVKPAVGKCIGQKGIGLLIKKLQNHIIEYGYITTRVTVPAQNLKSGSLILKVVAGQTGKVRLNEKSDKYISLLNTFPVYSDNLLNLRDIEQGLENLQRLPGSRASMKIAPGELPAQSDIIVDWRLDKMWRINASLDDSGNKSTGRYQGGLTLSANNPFSFGDLFYLSGTHDLHRHSDRGSQNITAHYSVPLGYWTLDITAYDYQYVQNVSGLYQDFAYSGRTKNLSTQLSRVLHRGSAHKTSFSGEIKTRQSSNYLEDVFLTGQYRFTSAWRLGLQHRHYLGQATLDAGLGYQQGTRWFGALPAPEELSGTATALSKIVSLNAQLNMPFQWGTQRFRYNTSFFQQISNTPLTSPEQLAIGSRWTVRGFDGERALSASRGWYWRNDFAWSTPISNQECYLGVDYGQVSGHGSEYLSGTHLAGIQLGLRGNAFHTSYGVFAGMPLSKPDGFETSAVTFGFNLGWSY